MAPEVLSRAFEPFFTTKSVGKGTGLGLSQIHGFAAQTGGRAEIESRSGEGTTLRLFLPRTDKCVAAPWPQTKIAVAAAAGKTILLVEDNDLVRAFAEGLLDDLGYRVISAASAEEALEALERGTGRSGPFRHRHAGHQRHRARAPGPPRASRPAGAARHRL